MTERRVWLVANPTSGKGTARQHAELLASRLEAAGITVQLVAPTSAEDLGSAVVEAVADDALAVIASGGDGTVHTAIQPLVGTDIPFGIVAAGSGDDIAAVLGVPDDSVEANVDYLVEAVLSLPLSDQVDVGRVVTANGTTRYFLAVLSTGFDSAVNERANRLPRLFGQRYNVAMLLELASFRPIDYDVTLDSEHLVGAGMLVAVGNGARYGGGMRICPDAQVDDGLLDVTWLHSVSRSTLVRVFPKVYSGAHVQHPRVTTHRGRHLTITASGQVAYADGERIGPLPIEVDVQPGALCLLTPKRT